jgi:hypothetical protein
VKLVLWSSSYAGPFLVPFAAWGLLSKRHRRLVVTIGAFCAYSFLTWWLFTHRIDRFLLPILPLAALLAGEGATWCSHARGPRIVFVLLLVCLVFQFLFGTSRVPVDNRFLVAMEDLYRDVPHKADLWFSRIHPAVHGINRLVGPGFRALAVGEAQVFDYEVQVLYNTCFDDCRFEQLMRGRTAEQRYAALCENRISHIFFSWSELDRYRTPGNYGYSNYVTRELVHRELLEEQKLLRRIPVPFTEESGEIFEVVGWQEWTPTATTSE